MKRNLMNFTKLLGIEEKGHRFIEKFNYRNEIIFWCCFENNLSLRRNVTKSPRVIKFESLSWNERNLCS